MLPRIPFIVGPTASGKTDMAVSFAELINGEIISADSRQVYRYLDIGTAKPSPDQLRKVKHFFINVRDPDQVFTAGEFGVEARKVAADIMKRGKTPVVVGGSGLYIRSMSDGLFEGPGSDPEIRKILENKVQHGQIHELLADLNRVDPESGAKADLTKPRRVVRALEVYYLTGKPISLLHRENRPDIGFHPIFYGLSWDRRTLYGRIEQRCDAMLLAGLLKEVADLKTRGYDRQIHALNTMGYAEALAHLDAETSFEEMVRLFKQNSRRYAKRQLTWFRADERITWVSMTGDRNPMDVAANVLGLFKSD